MGNVFRFKQFDIRQQDSAMKVGTDGVLLGAWVGVTNNQKKILDIGAGTGLISLMMAQRCCKARVDAVEVEPMAAQEANYNVKNSIFADRIEVFNEKFQEFAQKRDEQLDCKYDLIVSNPPYFNGTYKSRQAERTAARHVELLNSDDLIAGVMKVIDIQKGRFAAVFPYEVGAVFIAKAAVAGLYCNKITNVYPKRDKYIKRILAEFSLIKYSLCQSNLAIEEAPAEGICYTNEYKELTQDFYLKF